jgi:hypothetical protein
MFGKILEAIDEAENKDNNWDGQNYQTVVHSYAHLEPKGNIEQPHDDNLSLLGSFANALLTNSLAKLGEVGLAMHKVCSEQLTCYLLLTLQLSFAPSSRLFKSLPSLVRTGSMSCRWPFRRTWHPSRLLSTLPGTKTQQLLALSSTSKSSSLMFACTGLQLMPCCCKD